MLRPYGQAQSRKRGATMELIEKRMLIEHRDRRNVVPGFVTYISNSEPVLMHCYGWQDYSDGYDDYGIQTSRDNGRTWTDVAIKFRGIKTSGGKIRYGEHSAFWDPDSEKLIVLVDKTLYRNDAINSQTHFRIVEHVYDAQTGRWFDERDIDFGYPGPMAVSFCFPIKTSRGNIMVPVSRARLDDSGQIFVDERSRTPVAEPLTMMGRMSDEGRVDWRLGNPMQVDHATTTRGLGEHTYAELSDGRIAAILRGSNAGAPQMPGYKWLAFSSDDGLNWTEPVPVPDTSGNPVRSGANGSAFFRSIANQRLYWIGNSCMADQEAAGNFPRSPLLLVECREEPFAFDLDNAFIIDHVGAGDSPDLRLSNFRYVQDRITGELVVYVTRHAERGKARWQESDYYSYRVRLD